MQFSITASKSKIGDTIMRYCMSAAQTVKNSKIMVLIVPELQPNLSHCTPFFERFELVESSSAMSCCECEENDKEIEKDEMRQVEKPQNKRKGDEGIFGFDRIRRRANRK